MSRSPQDVMSAMGFIQRFVWTECSTGVHFYTVIENSTEVFSHTTSHSCLKTVVGLQ